MAIILDENVVLSMTNQTIPPLARKVWPLIQAPSGPARNETAEALSLG
jgi:hypothetical protein